MHESQCTRGVVSPLLRAKQHRTLLSPLAGGGHDGGRLSACLLGPIPTKKNVQILHEHQPLGSEAQL